MKPETRAKIVRGMVNGRFTSLLSASEIAAGSGVAEGTVRRALPTLIRERLVQHTSYVGLYAPTGRARDEYAE
jgi:DNA-binding IclR family transcriptional regulator